MELCSHKPMNTWSHQKLKEASEDSPLEFLEGVQPSQYLDFRLLVSRTVEEYVLGHQICSNLLQ